MRQSNAIIFTKSCARMLVTLCCKQELHQPSSLEFKTTKLLLHNPQGRKPGKNCNTCNTFQQSQEEIEVILITHFLSMMTPDEQTNNINALSM